MDDLIAALEECLCWDTAMIVAKRSYLFGFDRTTIKKAIEELDKREKRIAQLEYEVGQLRERIFNVQMTAANEEIDYNDTMNGLAGA